MRDYALVTRVLMAPSFVGGAALVIWWLVKVMGVSGFYAIPIMLIGLALWLNPRVVATLLPAAFTSSLLVPGLPAMMTLSQALSGLLGAWGVIHRATAKRGEIRWQTSDWGVAGFLAVCVFLMFARGFGMRVLGGTMYGGFGYIILFASGLGYLAAPLLRLDRRHVMMMVGMAAGASLIPLLMEISVWLTGGRTALLYRYFSLGAEYVLTAVVMGESAGLRLSAGRAVGTALIMIGLLTQPQNPLRRVVRASLLTGGIVVVLISGFRSVLVLVGMLITLWHAAVTRHRWLSAVAGVAAFLFLWAVALVGGTSLPGPIQRAVSFMPGVEVDPMIQSQAQASVDWRLKIWRIAVRNIPRYLWIGRGLVTDVSPLAWMRKEFYITPEFYYEMKGYHSGPLSLLLDFGLPGFVLGSMFMVGMCAEGWRLRRRLRPRLDDMLSRVHLFWLCLTTATVLSFYLIVGDVRASFPEIMVYGVALRLTGNCLSRSAAVDLHDASWKIPRRTLEAAKAQSTLQDGHRRL